MTHSTMFPFPLDVMCALLVWVGLVLAPILILLTCLWRLEEERWVPVRLVQDLDHIDLLRSSYILITKDGVLAVTGNELEVWTKKTHPDVKLVVSDLHKTLDSTSPHDATDLPDDMKLVVLSFIGKRRNTLIKAVMDIKHRIASGQVAFGVLNFNRGNDKRCIFTEEGSKAYACLKMSAVLFLDDAVDHVDSVSSLKIKSVKFSRDSENFWKVLADIRLKFPG